MNNDILNSAPFMSAIISLVLAQAIKPAIAVYTGKKFEKRLFWTTGGMPSSHSATVCALTTSIGMTYGIGTVYFAISFFLALITMHDAIGIRQQAGKQAEVINEWSTILAKMSSDFSQEHLKTMLGHSFTQVFGGGVFGIVIAVITTSIIHA